MRKMAAIILSNTFNRFFDSEKSSGILLIICTIIAIAMTNSPIGHDYLSLWQADVAGLKVEHWVNDGLMAIFFLLIGLELEREIYVGELSHIKNALLPICAAVGGMLLPALIHYLFNHATPTQNGIGIPMATDIAFALGVLAILGNRIPASLSTPAARRMHSRRHPLSALISWSAQRRQSSSICPARSDTTARFGLTPPITSI